ncbi:MAG TPA: hypothetical protein VFR68_05945 [Candidatus Dormibacteraeota bacterium]|nr:hypothetical protein [Candidatus Dormibacteraeota bacterium]
MRLEDQNVTFEFGIPAAEVEAGNDGGDCCRTSGNRMRQLEFRLPRLGRESRREL